MKYRRLTALILALLIAAALHGPDQAPLYVLELMVFDQLFRYMNAEQ